MECILEVGLPEVVSPLVLKLCMKGQLGNLVFEIH